MAGKVELDNRDDVKRHDHPLWAENEAVYELARITAILISFRRTGSNPIHALARQIADHAHNAGHTRPNDGIFYDEIYRLVSFSHITNKARILDAIADYVLTEIGKLLVEKENSKYLSHVYSRINLPVAFDDYKSNKLEKPIISRYGLGPMAAVTGLQEFPKIYPDQFKDAATYLTGVALSKDEERVKHLGHYDCFRYSVIVGHIAKSHFEFQPCCESDPVCRFDNFFKDRSGASRNSSGIAYSTGEWIYLVGQLRREHGVKVLAMRATGQSQPDVIPALLMSKSITPLVARAVLHRKNGPLPSAELRIADERTDAEFSSDEFRTRLLHHIRNSMDFRLENQLVFENENGKLETFTQSRMVEYLPSLIRGKFFLRDSKGALIPFNPASHEHYPFNQAIVIDE